MSAQQIYTIFCLNRTDVPGDLKDWWVEFMNDYVNVAAATQDVFFADPRDFPELFNQDAAYAEDNSHPSPFGGELLAKITADIIEANSASTPSPSPPLPPLGVKVLSGRAIGVDAFECVTNPTQTSVGSGAYATIAAQCCEADGTCRRFVDGKNNDEGCIAGHSGQVVPKGAITPTTYSEAYAMCDALGLQLCDKSCVNQGCFYNNHPGLASD